MLLWVIEMEEIMVSVLCLAYNHEKYVRQALESIVAQKADFKFEVLVHDDASTDGTADIIREFEQKYPDIVKPIYQTENQYSKHIKIHEKYSFPRARGKYFAFCECDDYWVDPCKLQKQVDYMETHPECALCIHNALQVNVAGSIIGSMRPTEKDRIISCEEVILGGGGFCATNSILAPMKYAEKLPSFFAISAQDAVWQMYLASCGTTYCFQEEMSAYRVGVPGGWISRMKKDPKAYSAHYDKVVAVKRAFDEYTNCRFHDTIEESIINSTFSYLYRQDKFRELQQEPYKSCSRRKELSVKGKLKIFLGVYFPCLLRLVEKKAINLQ